MTNAERTKIIYTIRKEVKEGCKDLAMMKEQGEDISVIYGHYLLMYGKINILHQLELIDTSEYNELDMESWKAYKEASKIKIS